MIKNPLHILHLNNYPILNQLQVEEALLRADERNWCILNHGSPPAIVMGISNKPHELLDQNPLPLIRRFSGGGTVVVNEETLFCTFIMNEGTVGVNHCPKKILEWSSRCYRSILDQHGFGIKENDYVLGSRKFGGNAQSLIRRRWLHHSSLLWNYDVEQMRYLKIPQKMPAYREGRQHQEFLCRLKDYLDRPEVLFDEIKIFLNQLFTLEYHSIEEIKSILDLPHRKATTLV